MKFNLNFIARLLQAGVAAAPDVEKFVVEARQFLTTMFSSQPVPVETQNEVFAYVESLALAVRDGKRPPEYVVEP